jgi:amino acid adenylation domain-containing protein
MLLQNLLTSQAQARPDSAALICGRESIGYGELDALTNRVARQLVEAGCEPGDRVGILLPKSIPAIAAMIGSLKAGCIYVPLDTGSPSARLAKIVDACEPKCILASSASATLLDGLFSEPAKTARIGWLGPDSPPERLGVAFTVAFTWDDVLQTLATPLACGTKAQDAAHILFTSGSTGVPKGVVITHSNIMSFLEWAARYFRPSPSDRISCHPPLHFDLSTFDIYGTLMAGAELHLVPPEISLLPHKLAEFIRNRRLTQWFSVPSALKYMAQFDVLRAGDFPALERLLWCGEALPAGVLIYFMERLPHVAFTNLYGPTETTIASSFYTVPSCPKDEQAEIPIGRACDGERLLVLDDALRPAPPGEIGALYIQGVGLSPGYWRDPEKTRSVFLDDDAHGRMYNTGDLARTGEDRLIYLLGRADSQIKSRGYRIELGEIEAALCALGVLRECAVVAIRSEGFEGMTICCAYALPQRVSLEPADLRARLMRLLPTYMLPSQWMHFDALPLNGNGKVDRPRLKQHFLTAAAPAAAQAGGALCSSRLP